MIDDNDWEEVWNARAEAFSTVFGVSHNEVYHAPHPFALGGNSEVMRFSGTAIGTAYVTAELSDRPEASYADYELMICHRTADDWGPNIISHLAPYTQQAYIGSGETMDIDEATPPNSEIKAFLFDTFGSFILFGHCFDLRLCTGITKEELEFKMQHGAEKLLSALKRQDVYPFTDLNRGSILLPDE